jgi:hypothetical protein
MRALIVATPAFPIPPQELPRIAEEALLWSERHKDELDQFGMFPGGGGFGVADVADEAALSQLIMEMPFSPFSHHDVRPFVPGQTALHQLQASHAARAPAQAG